MQVGRFSELQSWLALGGGENHQKRKDEMRGQVKERKEKRQEGGGKE